MKASVLIVDDERLIRTSLERAFAADGYIAKGAATIEEARQALREGRCDLVILDLRLGDRDGLEVLRHARAEAPETKVIVITAHGSVEAAVEAMKLGAYDFVKKPFELDELLAAARNAVATSALERRLEYHERRDRREHEEGMVPSSAPAMQRLEREVAIVAAQPVPVVLLRGETGVGKAMVARQLHYGSSRAAQPFVELNAAAIPETLVESELFGHERGAFSDARERKLGLVEVADGGTLLLDEVGDLGAASQAKLLTFLESFAFRRVGGLSSRTVDVRVVAATNRDLPALAKEGKFRSDLYYRLAALQLLVPPLRERRQDVAPLAEHFIRLFAQRYAKRFSGLDPAAKHALERWSWPGNVRELRAVVNRAVLMNDGEALRLGHLPPELLAATIDPLPAALAAAAAGTIATLEEVELRYMREVLALFGGNKVRAAERLGITRQTLAKRLGESE